MYLNKLVKEFKIRNYKMFPMQENDIDELILTYGKLPEAYVELLQLIGSGTTAPFWQGQSFFRNDIPYLNTWAKEILIENRSKVSLKFDDYVFWMSQGTMFCFFKLNYGDNPPVYLYTENDLDRFICISRSLTEFIWNYCFNCDTAFKEISLVE